MVQHEEVNSEEILKEHLKLKKTYEIAESKKVLNEQLVRKIEKDEDNEIETNINRRQNDEIANTKGNKLDQKATTIEPKQYLEEKVRTCDYFIELKRQ